MARKKPKVTVTRRLHRSFGAGTAVFVIFMVLSGLAINHSNRLGLDQRHVSQPSLLSWYGLGEPEHIHSFAAGSDWLSFAGSQLYLNGHFVTSITNGIGAVFNGDMLVAAGSNELLLLDRDGTLIERQSWGPPGTGLIESIGLLADGAVALRSSSQLWWADAELLNWQHSEDASATPAWSSPGLLPQAFQQAITQHYRGDGLSMERLLLDFHSGRIFGPIGVLVYDLLALTIGFLAISGLVLWLRGRRKGRTNGRN